MKRYQNTLRLAIVVRCVAIAPTAGNLHAIAPRSSEAVLRCVMPVLPVLGWAGLRSGPRVHSTAAMAQLMQMDSWCQLGMYRYSRRMEVRHRLVLMSASGALVRNRRDCARSPLQPPGKTAAPDHGFIRAAAGAACMRTLPWAPPAPLCISISAQHQAALLAATEPLLELFAARVAGALATSLPAILQRNCAVLHLLLHRSCTPSG
jgi:hypothetical protein